MWHFIGLMMFSDKLRHFVVYGCTAAKQEPIWYGHVLVDQSMYFAGCLEEPFQGLRQALKSNICGKWCALTVHLEASQ